MAGGIRTRREADEMEEAHEINVTPFIDVMLVLLIVFMVAAPLATVDVPVSLPGSTAAQQPRPESPVYLSVGADGTLSLGDRPVADTDLPAALDTATKGDHDTRIYLRADKALTYGAVMAVMNRLRAAGYLKVALVGLETGARP